MSWQRSRSFARNVLALVRVLGALAALGACAAVPPESRILHTPVEVELERKCQQRSFAACGELGRILVEAPDGKEPSTKRLNRGRLLLEVACGQEDGPACVALARNYVEDRGTSSLVRARAIAAPWCERGTAEACTPLGKALALQRDEAEAALAAFRKGCSLGDAEACELLATRLLGEWLDAGRAEAEAALGRACTAGRASSCHHLARMLLRNPERAADGLALLGRNCERGHVDSCETLAHLSAPLIGRPPNCERARGPATRACKEKQDAACAILDACALGGAARAERLESLRLACTKDTGLACLYWADAVSAEPGSDATRVEQAYAAACRDRADAAWIACPRLAAIALGRVKLSIDAERPLEELRAACERSSAEACCVLAAEHRRGRWLPQDATKAAELREKACAIGACCRE